MRSAIYPKTEGVHGVTWTIAKGVKVRTSVNGTYEIDVNERGNRTRRRVDGLEKALEAAETFALRLGLELKADVRGSGDALTFGDASGDWFKIHEKSWRKSTRERYRGLLDRYILPALGEKSVDADHSEWRRVVKLFLADQLGECSPKSVELMHVVIHGVFAEMMDNGRLRDNPAKGLLKSVLPPKNRRNIKKPDPFSKEDLTAFLATARRVLPDDRAMCVEVMAKTGMRLGEALAMHVDRLDVRNCQYDVREAIHKGEIVPPKSGNARLVDLSPALVPRLQSYIARRNEEAMSTGTRVEYLFQGLNERHLDGAMKRVCKAAGLRVRPPHQLRHTYAVLMLMDHTGPGYVCRQLGHSSISITCDVYGRWIPGEGRKDFEKVLNVFDA
jgi:integrase